MPSKRQTRIEGQAKMLEAKHGKDFPKLPTDSSTPPRPVGRPKKEVTLDQIVPVRMTAKDVADIDSLAKFWECDRSEAMRRAIQLASGTLPKQS